MTPILRDIPDAFETERLIVCCPGAGDGAAVHATVVETLAELRARPASLPWAQAEPSIEASEEFCRHACADFLARRNLAMLLFEKAGGDLVGSSGLHDRTRRRIARHLRLRHDMLGLVRAGRARSAQLVR